MMTSNFNQIEIYERQRTNKYSEAASDAKKIAQGQTQLEISRFQSIQHIIIINLNWSTILN